MRQCYQRGCLRYAKRKSGSDCWEFLWRETDATGKRVRRTAFIGTVDEYPTRELAQAAANGLRMRVNEDRNRELGRDILVEDLVDHYWHTELCDKAEWHSLATKIVYRAYLKRWICPYWGKTSIYAIRTIAVERWLRWLRRSDGNLLADSTKAKIRNLLSTLFNHAIRYEWFDQGRNPITLVRQSAKRQRTPEVLETVEIQRLVQELDSCFRLMVILDVTTGLRRSELFALKWSDIDFSNLLLDVQRSIYLGRVGNCKTEASRKPVPLDERVAADIWLWKEASNYRQADDWIFASPHTDGRRPFWPDAVLQKVIRPAALRARFGKVMGWHTFRHTYSTLLIANGENVKVVQELMRHANSRSTLEIYSQARIEHKRKAQQRLAEAIFRDEDEIQIPVVQRVFDDNLS
jgi:integrase